MVKPTKKYGQDPILEAICEFHFVPSDDWSPSSIELMHEKVAGDFPDKKICQVVTHEFEQLPEGPPKHSVQTIDRTQFWSKDGKAVIQTNKDFLCVNHQKPYPTWQVYFPMIKCGLDAYVSLHQEQKISLVQITYLNRIELPGNSAKLKDYLNFYAETAESLPLTFSNFIVGATIPVDDQKNGVIKLQINTADRIDQREVIPIIIEISHKRVFDPVIDASDALAWVNASHIKIRELFESAITKETRDLFGEPNND